mmetsp:Transcript_11780/g.17574  ORF Transcript_11780/g.17574 Transcript_11780/m.17574 type:complete len:133 (-) Transcript_11780:73-471(-)
MPNRIKLADGSETHDFPTITKPKLNYAHFASIEKRALSRCGPQVKKNMSRIFGQRWQLMSDEEIACYHKIAEVDKVRYEKEYLEKVQVERAKDKLRDAFNIFTSRLKRRRIEYEGQRSFWICNNNQQQRFQI